MVLVLALGVPFAVVSLAVIISASHRRVRTATPAQSRRVTVFALSTGTPTAVSLLPWSATIGSEQWVYLVAFTVAVAAAPLAARRDADPDEIVNISL